MTYFWDPLQCCLISYESNGETEKLVDLIFVPFSKIRWNKTLLPARQKVGKWSINEDKRLRVAVTLFGHKSWHRIAQFVPGRTQAQCRER